MKEGMVKGIVTVIVALSIMFTCSIPIILNYWKQECKYRRAHEEENDEK